MSFKAAVQYGDFGGTAAADRADKGDLQEYLRANNLIAQNEYLIAAEVWIGENHEGVVKKPSIRALVVDAPNHAGAVEDILNQDPVPVRAIEVSVSLEQFIGFFKRLAVTLTLGGTGLDSKDYKEI